ncbi:MAG: hypothetical protein JWQ38_543 [Flavipsychrobacter sp.]|nr:hypothetical protein [Flavipsychrobacter sp.]
MDRVGLWNMVAIVLIAIVAGLLSLLFVMSSVEGAELKKHLVQFFFHQLWVLMLLSMKATAILLVVNVVVQLILQRRLVLPVLGAIVLLSLVISFVSISAGLVMLCTLL